jgi:hypothetical protein
VVIERRVAFGVLLPYRIDPPRHLSGNHPLEAAGILGQELRRPDHTDGVIRFERAHHRFQHPIVAEVGIIIDEHQQIPATPRDSLVARAAGR